LDDISGRHPSAEKFLKVSHEIDRLLRSPNEYLYLLGTTFIPIYAFYRTQYWELGIIREDDIGQKTRRDYPGTMLR